MKWLSYAISVLIGLLAAQIAFSAWLNLPPSVTPQVNISYVQMILTFLTAVLLAIFGFATTRSNEQFKARLSAEAARTLAELQANLAVETASSVEKIRSEFAASVNEATERLRFEFSKSSEDFKARLAQTIPQRYNGYHLMFKAATKYFFAIRRLEEGIYPDDDMRGAAAAADDAIGSALVVDADDRASFFKFVTEATFVAESARENRSPDAIQTIWETEGKRLGKKYNELEAQFSAKVRA